MNLYDQTMPLPLPPILDVDFGPRARPRRPWLAYGIWDALLWTQILLIAYLLVVPPLWWFTGGISRLDQWLYPSVYSSWALRQSVEGTKYLVAFAAVSLIRGHIRALLARRSGGDARRAAIIAAKLPSSSDAPIAPCGLIREGYLRRLSRSWRCPLDPAAGAAVGGSTLSAAVPIVIAHGKGGIPGLLGDQLKIQSEKGYRATELHELSNWSDPIARLATAAALLLGVAMMGFGAWRASIPPFHLAQSSITQGFIVLALVAWHLLAPAGLAPFRISSCIARPGGVSYSGWFRRIEFTPADTLLLIEGQWRSLTLITFIRTDGAWRRLTVDQTGLTHLLGCWRPAEPALSVRPPQ